MGRITEKREEKREEKRRGGEERREEKRRGKEGRGDMRREKIRKGRGKKRTKEIYVLNVLEHKNENRDETTGEKGGEEERRNRDAEIE
tara:strand:- start:443 stop:706 length:264 start_codon:yes stop_codon:yes gene_type:complete